jgi:hypothetical protein
MISKEIMDAWTARAWSLPQPAARLSFPINVLTGEALDVLRFCQRNWEPALDPVGKPIRPGLKSAVGNGTFTEEVAREIHELIDAFQEAQNHYRLLVDVKGPNPMDRAQYLLGEMRNTLEWYFDDGKTDASDAQLEALRKAHDRAVSQDDVAGALLEYAALARRHRSQIDGLEGFNAALIDEAPGIAAALRERSAGPETAEQPAVREALELRNRLGAMLLERMLLVRSAARFVFRAHPALVREVTSRYSRTRRAVHRNRKNAEGEDVVEGEAVVTEEVPVSE